MATRKQLNTAEYATVKGAVAWYLGETMKGDKLAAAYPPLLVSEWWTQLTPAQCSELMEIMKTAMPETGDVEVIGKDGETEVVSLGEWRKFCASLDKDNFIVVTTVDNRAHQCFAANDKFYPVKTYVAEPQQETYIPVTNIIKAQ